MRIKAKILLQRTELNEDGKEGGLQKDLTHKLIEYER